MSEPPVPNDQKTGDTALLDAVDVADPVEIVQVKRPGPPRPAGPVQPPPAPEAPSHDDDDDDEPTGVFIAPMPIISLGAPVEEGDAKVEVGAHAIRRPSIAPRPTPSPPPVGAEAFSGLDPGDELTLPRARPPADSFIQPVPTPRPPLQSDPRMERPFAHMDAGSPSEQANGAAEEHLFDVAPDSDWQVTGAAEDEEADVPIEHGETLPDEEVLSSPELELLSAGEPAVAEAVEAVEVEPEPEPDVHLPPVEPVEAEPKPAEASGPEPFETDWEEPSETSDAADLQQERVSDIPPEVDPADLEIHEAPIAPAGKPPERATPGFVLPLPLPLQRADLGAAIQGQLAIEGASAKRARYWWDELFGDDFLRTMDRLTDAQIKREVNFIEESLAVQKGGIILDLACGAGRHAVEMAVRGYNMVGYDLSLAMLARAADEAHDRGQKLNFLHGDMRDMGFEEMFDGVYCWSTSFGYFDDEKNMHVAQRIHRALRKGGMLLLDLANRDFVTQRQPSLVWFEGEGCVCMDEMRVDFIHSRLRVKRMVMLDDGRTRELDYSIRLYTLHELGRMLHDVGFKVTEVSGHTATPGVFMGGDSPRLIVLAEKA